MNKIYTNGSSLAKNKGKARNNPMSINIQVFK